MYGPANTALHELQHSTYVRFSLLAFSSIFFLVDPFAAIGSFLAITAGADPARRKRMAFKASLTCFIVLTAFAFAGQFIFSLFGIKLPAFEIAGGLILLLIGAFPTWPHSRAWGYGPTGGLGVVLIVVIVLLVVGVI